MQIFRMTLVPWRYPFQGSSFSAGAGIDSELLSHQGSQGYPFVGGSTDKSGGVGRAAAIMAVRKPLERSPVRRMYLQSSPG